MKTILHMLAGALICAAIGAAFAVTGTPPGNGPQLVDGLWLQGLANGVNNSYQSGLTGAGTTQATATALPAAIYMLEADTVAASTGFNLPTALAGAELSFYNNGANTATLYPAVANNPITAIQDTINNTTSVSVASHVAEFCFAAKNGIWACK